MPLVVSAETLRLYKKQFNFFETPEPLADRMAAWIDDLPAGSQILEPSAGMGALIKAVQRTAKNAPLHFDACEPQSEFVEILELLGATHVAYDFADYAPRGTSDGQGYDAVIMNPPFKNRMAETHVDLAWNHLKPGGRLVALVGTSATRYIDRARDHPERHLP